MKIWQTTFLLKVIFMVNNVYSFPHLSSLSEMNATWKASNTIPCRYQPSDEYIQKEIRWSKDDRTVIQRDKSGDHIPMSKYRGKASILNSPAGDVSLILNVMLGDSGVYFCEVTWTSRGTKETATNKVHTQVKVIKVEVTKPVVTPSGSRYLLYEGEMLDLICKSQGTPPIEYKWYKICSGCQDKMEISSDDTYKSPSVSHSDEGRYYCEATNSFSGQTYLKTSEKLELVILDKTTTTNSPTIKTKTAATSSPTRKMSLSPFTTEVTAKKSSHVSEATTLQPVFKTTVTTKKSGRVSETTTLQPLFNTTVTTKKSSHVSEATTLQPVLKTTVTTKKSGRISEASTLQPLFNTTVTAKKSSHVSEATALQPVLKTTGTTKTTVCITEATLLHRLTTTDTSYVNSLPEHPSEILSESLRDSNIKNRTEEIEQKWIMKLQADKPPGINVVVSLQSTVTDYNSSQTAQHGTNCTVLD
ncbi:V-set and immunoglobulin domain-containing protein 4-like [Protopterus annectens]|uniref:V-set and immunoglobulin domain-containing protein 4-like n=1 Tax=Protopterus annectens TaxID=7888 RepID=UPI001CF95F6E|nr:V-set and immunoglobulin domain-containing protein 4-like [Protopterus annectens]